MAPIWASTIVSFVRVTRHTSEAIKMPEIGTAVLLDSPCKGIKNATTDPRPHARTRGRTQSLSDGLVLPTKPNPASSQPGQQTTQPAANPASSQPSHQRTRPATNSAILADDIATRAGSVTSDHSPGDIATRAGSLTSDLPDDASIHASAHTLNFTRQATFALVHVRASKIFARRYRHAGRQLNL